MTPRIFIPLKQKPTNYDIQVHPRGGEWKCPKCSQEIGYSLAGITSHLRKHWRKSEMTWKQTRDMLDIAFPIRAKAAAINKAKDIANGQSTAQ